MGSSFSASGPDWSPGAFGSASRTMPAVSSSSTFTVRLGSVGAPKKPPLHALPVRAWLIVAASSRLSLSLAAVAVTVWGVFQFDWVKVSAFVCGVASVSRDTSALPLVAVTITLQLPPPAVLGLAVRRTV